MDPRNAQERREPVDLPACEPEAIEFVRFCYRRRRVGWPELYDEMCAVAGRGIYRGYGSDDLNQIGIGFALFEMPLLASLVQRVVAEDQERRRLSAEAVRSSHAPPTPATAPIPLTPAAAPADAEPVETSPRMLAVAGA